MLTVALRKFSVKARHPVRVAVWCFAPVGIPRCAGGVGEGWGEKGGELRGFTVREILYIDSPRKHYFLPHSK